MEMIREVLNHLMIGEPVSMNNLTMFPIQRESSRPPDYVTLDEALEHGWATVTEISEEGSVPQLRFENRADRPVLLVDGEELVGAKQDRILNLTILIPALQTVIIPVSCVEQGRWSRRSRGFRSSKSALYYRARAAKTSQVSASMAMMGERSSSQGGLWQSISSMFKASQTDSKTYAMSDLYDKSASKMNDYTKAFELSPQQVGAIFAVNGHICGFDLFEHTEILKRVFPKLVRSYALEALIGQEAKHEECTTGSAFGFLSSVSDTAAKTYPAIGLGQDIRLSGTGIAGGALALEDRLIHLNAFRMEEGQGEGH